MRGNEVRSSSIPISGLKVSRKLLPFLASFVIASCGYADESEKPDIQVQSKNSLGFLAQCVSQDWDSVFPRMFPVSKSDGVRSFRTYNGILITIKDLGTVRVVELRAPKSLNGEMVRYLRKCGSDVW